MVEANKISRRWTLKFSLLSTCSTNFPADLKVCFSDLLEWKHWVFLRLHGQSAQKKLESVKEHHLVKFVNKMQLLFFEKDHLEAEMGRSDVQKSFANN